MGLAVSIRPGTKRVVALVVLISAALGGAAMAQRGFGFAGIRYPFQALPNAKYDGRFTFVRLSYETAPGGYWYRGLPAWAHGYPVAERNLMKIMNEVSYLGAHDDEVNTLELDDPDLFHYPVAYIIEVSWWTMTDKQGKALRAYLDKGGFLIVDDFKQTGDFGSAGWESVRGQRQADLSERPVRRHGADAPDFPHASSRSTPSSTFRRPTTPAGRCFEDCSRTTIRRAAFS